MTVKMTEKDNDMQTSMIGRPINFNKRLEGNPRRVFVEMEVQDDGSMHVVSAEGEVVVNQYAMKTKKLRARSVQRVIRNAAIKRCLTVN